MNSKLREALEELVANINASMDFVDVYTVVEHHTLAKAEATLAEQICEAEWKLGAEYEYAYCSHCGRQQWASWDSFREAAENIGEFYKEYKFCPNCGFKMKGTTNE